jgi:hypothetical protein
MARRSRSQNSKFEKSEYGWTEILPKMNEFQDLHCKGPTGLALFRFARSQ